MSSSFLFSGFIRILQNVPTLAALIAGFVFAILRMKRHPKASTAAAIGFGGLLFFNLAGLVLSGLLGFMVQREMYGFYMVFQGLYIFGSAILGAACYGLLVYGYFFTEGRAQDTSANVAPKAS